MAQDSSNPFVMPGFGQQGDAAHNPLFAGLEMMRQAWQGMASPGSLESAAMPAMSIEDLDKRIRELQTVQNWLQLNASMLASTIQGLEIQRSTLATLKNFADHALAGRPETKDDSAPADSQQAGQDYAQAATDWWAMMQQQFGQLLAATMSTAQAPAEAPKASATKKPAANRPAGTRTAAAKSATAARSGKTGKTGK